jgi:hypothetical protein
MKKKGSGGEGHKLYTLASFTVRSLQTSAIEVMLSSFYVQPLGVWLIFFVNSGVWCSRIDLESNSRQDTSCCYHTINAYL